MERKVQQVFKVTQGCKGYKEAPGLQVPRVPLDPLVRKDYQALQVHKDYKAVQVQRGNKVLQVL
jgi:hypothetical protein